MNNLITKSAMRFRLAMAVLFVVLVAAATVVAFLGVQQLNGFAKEVSAVVYEASSSEQKLAGIRSLREQMNSQPDAVRRAEDIVAESKSYRYQNVIVNDIRAMADRAGVEIINYTFSSPDGSAAGAAAPAPAAPVAPAPDAAVPGDPTSAAPLAAQSTLKSITFDITLRTPVEYDRLLRFIHYIEQNATKMQIATLNISKGESANSVSIDALTIEVYVR